VFLGRSPDESGNSVRVVPASGGEPELLAPPSSQVTNWWDACWLPDGQTVVSSALNVRQPGLFRIDTRTREITPLRGAEQLIWPKCSWQGEILALQPGSTASASGAGPRVFWPERHAAGPILGFDLAYPNWTRDGKAIVGLNLATRNVERFSVDTRRSESLGDLSGVPLEGLAYAPWMGLAPGDVPLVLRSHTTHELYALDWEAP
jgi:hypothetical protein